MHRPFANVGGELTTSLKMQPYENDPVKPAAKQPSNPSHNRDILAALLIMGPIRQQLKTDI